MNCAKIDKTGQGSRSGNGSKAGSNTDSETPEELNIEDGRCCQCEEGYILWPHTNQCESDCPDDTMTLDSDLNVCVPDELYEQYRLWYIQSAKRSGGKCFPVPNRIVLSQDFREVDITSDLLSGVGEV